MRCHASSQTGKNNSIALAESLALFHAAFIGLLFPKRTFALIVSLTQLVVVEEEEKRETSVAFFLTSVKLPTRDSRHGTSVCLTVRLLPLIRTEIMKSA